MNRKLCFIYGTRPEIIKLNPLIKLCKRERVPFFLVHTGQHYSYDMDEMLVRELNLPPPDYRLQIRSSAPYRQGHHTGRMLIKIEEILLKEMPYCVVVQGDTNSVLAGAMTAEKISTTESYTGFHIKMAHVEAGLRSFDRSMPEEINRFIVDHLSDFLFVPTLKEKEILLREGIPEALIYATGNTIVDAVQESLVIAERKSTILKKLNLKKNSYLLLTLHRQENVDSSIVLSSILKGLAMVVEQLKMPIIFPIHPRTKKMLKRFSLKVPKGIRLTAPVGFLDFIFLEANAALIMTDSGGVQEESCILRVPCVTLRNNTERPETVDVGSNSISGTQSEKILQSVLKMLTVRRQWKNPFGDGKASQRILEILMN